LSYVYNQAANAEDLESPFQSLAERIHALETYTSSPYNPQKQ
jgi:hypothetical protein